MTIYIRFHCCYHAVLIVVLLLQWTVTIQAFTQPITSLHCENKLQQVHHGIGASLQLDNRFYKTPRRHSLFSPVPATTSSPRTSQKKSSWTSTSLHAKDSRQSGSGKDDSKADKATESKDSNGRFGIQAINIFFTSDSKDENATVTINLPEDIKEDEGRFSFVRNIFRRDKSDKETVNGDANQTTSKQNDSENRQKKVEKLLQDARKQQEAALKKIEQENLKKEQEERKRLEKENKKRQKELREQEKQRMAAKRKAEDEKNKKEEEASIFRRVASYFNGTKESEAVAEDEKESSGTLSYLTKLVTSKISNYKYSNDEEWMAVFPKTRIDPGEVVPVTIAGIDLLVIASADGRRLYCIPNSCPHLGTPLETGQIIRLPAANNKSPASTIMSSDSPTSWTELEVSSILQQDGCEDCIVCPLHRTAFALQSGEVRGEWCPYPPILGKVMGAYKKPTPMAVFDVRYRGKNVEVRLNSPLDPKPRRRPQT
jgi:nitrite reductase/ring-hydroxylating ferredoxin subunit